MTMADAPDTRILRSFDGMCIALHDGAFDSLPVEIRELIAQHLMTIRVAAHELKPMREMAEGIFQEAFEAMRAGRDGENVVPFRRVVR